MQLVNIKSLKILITFSFHFPSSAA